MYVPLFGKLLFNLGACWDRGLDSDLDQGLTKRHRQPLTIVVIIFRLSPCGERSSQQLVDNTCKVSPVTEKRPSAQDERVQRRDTIDAESRMSIINNKLSSLDSASPTDPGYQRAMSSPQRTVPPIPPSFRAQQSCPESLTVPSRRRPPPIEKQRTPPPIPARRKPPPV